MLFRSTKAQEKQVRDETSTDAKTVERKVIEVPVTGDATSPRKCYELYRQAIKQSDYDACWNLLSAPARDAYETAASDLKTRVRNNLNPADADRELLGVLGLTTSDAEKLNGKMLMDGSMKRESIRNPEGLNEITRTEFDHEAIWGDKARVYVKIPGQRQAESMSLLREANVWRIDMRPMRQAN